MNLNLWGDKKIGILGYGIEGKSSYLFLTEHLHISPHMISIRDQATTSNTPTQAEIITGENYLSDLTSLDIVIRSSGVQPHLPELQQFQQQGGRVTSQIEIFFHLYTGKSIGITATKGKTTIAELTYHMTQKAGLDSILLGNGGIAALDIFKRKEVPAYAILELSSYMLEQCHPHTYISVLGNLYHEHHAQRHGSQQQYYTAKWHIATNAQHSFVGSQIENIPAEQQSLERFGKQGLYQHTPQGITRAGKLFIEKNNIGLLGEHNHYNICAALSIAEILGIDKAVRQQSIKEFQGVEHRLEHVGSYGGITWYNDAIASTPESTIAALKALPQTTTLFLGGKDGDYSYDTLIQQIQQSNVQYIVCYPYTGKELYEKLKNDYQCYFTQDFEQGIQRASEQTPTGGTALLSCGSAYTLGIPFQQKGNRFKTYVKSL